jgi:hypothetical protein
LVAINDLPMAVPAGVWANTYADNIIIVCSTREEADEAEQRLHQYFDRHPAGPFRLRITCRGKVGNVSFDHLGYTVCAEGNSIAVWPTTDNLIAISERASQHAAAHFQHSDEGVGKDGMDFVSAETDRIHRSFPLMCESALDAIADEVSSQFQLARSVCARGALAHCPDLEEMRASSAMPYCRSITEIRNNGSEVIAK